MSSQYLAKEVADLEKRGGKLYSVVLRQQESINNMSVVVNDLKHTTIRKNDKVKVVYPHLGIEAHYLVREIDSGVMELVAEETMKKI
ncbi:hypothetical protein ACQKLM_07540 [Bacillus thuringiensis]|uniref:hypothetical protein n=1 Tax=Bacillus thuringiensis TaxID=1428 RepID=UPI003CFD551D